MTQRWDTPKINPTTWQCVAERVIEVLADRGIAEVITLHGWTESAFADHPAFETLQWTEVRSPVAGLPALLRARHTVGFTLGRDDWWWRGQSPGTGQLFELLFCHEGDLHLESQDQALIQRLSGALSALGADLNPRKLIP